MEDFSNTHTSKHRTEGGEGNCGTTGHSGDGGNERKMELRGLGIKQKISVSKHEGQTSDRGVFKV